MSTAAVTWWNESLDHVGLQSMEKLLPPDAGWNDVLTSGREDLRPALETMGMTTGQDRTVLDIGCGVGRLSQNLVNHFGRVVGIDIAEKLIERARAQNTNPAITFECCDGERLSPQACREFDTVFSYEVLYYIDANTLRQYFRDIASLLKNNGEFVFQMNFNALTWKTRVSYLFRDLLFACGIKTWRGWPTTPGFRRSGFSRDWITRELNNVGLQVERVIDDDPAQSWILARKTPAAT